MKQATLPDRFISHTLFDAPLDEVVYIHPWALHVDNHKRLWLDQSFGYSHQSFGTQSMAVVKKQDGYIVDISRCDDSKWSISNRVIDDDRFAIVIELKS